MVIGPLHRRKCCLKYHIGQLSGFLFPLDRIQIPSLESKQFERSWRRRDITRFGHSLTSDNELLRPLVTWVNLHLGVKCLYRPEDIHQQLKYGQPDLQLHNKLQTNSFQCKL